MGDLDKKPEARKLVSDILDLPSSLRLRVIAEGIETAGQLEVLQEMDCEMGRATTSPARFRPRISRYYVTTSPRRRRRSDT